MDRFFLVDVTRRYIGTQVDYTSAPEWFESEGDQKKVTDINLISALDKVHFRSKKKNTDEFESVTAEFQGSKRKVIVGFEAGKTRAYIIAPEWMIKAEYEAFSSDRYVWDFLQCFKAPSDIGYEKGKLYKVEDLDPKSIEYRYVAYKFGKTINGRNEGTLQIKKTIRDMIAEGLPPESKMVKRVQKVYNYVLF